MPGEEVHLRAFGTEFVSASGEREKLWLNTSPEFAMKRLIVAGAGPIFQLGARVAERGAQRPPCARIYDAWKWYRPGAGFSDMMDETETLLRAVLPPLVSAAGVTTDLSRFERLSVAEAFSRYAGADLLGTACDAAALAASAGAKLRGRRGLGGSFFPYPA